jgi:hypothetical protein
MKSLNLSRFAIGLCTVALLVDCSSLPVSLSKGQDNMPPVSAPDVRPHQRSWVSAGASSDNLVYITQDKSVDIYSFSGKKVGSLTGLYGPRAICSDAEGNVWVAYGAGLLEYAHGGTIPIAQLYLPRYFHALSCAVDPTSGDIAVAESSASKENVAVFHDIYGTPQTYTTSNLYDYLYLGYDDQGNLFLNGTYKKRPAFAELLKGAQAFSQLSVDEKFGKPGGLQWNGQYLALGDSSNHVVYQMSVASGHATTQSTTHFHNWKPKFKEIVPFAIQDGVIVLPYSATNTGYFNFPQGGQAIAKIGASTNGGIAISVAPSRRAGAAPRVRRAGNSKAGSRSWVRRDASGGALLYAGGYFYGTGVFIYSYPQAELVGRLDVAGEPVCSDSAGNIFLRWENGVTEYAHGGSTPIRTLRIPGAEIYSCSVDPATNNLALVFSCPPCGYQDLAIYTNGSGAPTRYKTGTSALACGYDGNGNLFVSNLNSDTSLSELPAGSSNLMTVTLDKEVAPDQVQWDGEHMTLQSRGHPFSIYPISVEGSTATVLKPTKFKVKIAWVNPSWIYDGTVVFSFNKHDEPPNEIGIWKYPRGVHPQKTIHNIPYGDAGFGSVIVSAPPSHR